MPAENLIELPYSLSKYHYNMQTRSKDAATELRAGHPSFRVLPLRDIARATAATQINKSILPTAKPTVPLPSKATSKSILLYSRPNLSSFSRLLKRKYRMARSQVPRKPARLSTAKEQRSKIEKARFVLRDPDTRPVGRPWKAETAPATSKNFVQGTHIGSQTQPIVIDGDATPTLEPEMAPINFMDDLLAPAERLVTPEASLFQYTPTCERSLSIQVPHSDKVYSNGTAPGSSIHSSYAPLPPTRFQFDEDSLRVQTLRQRSHLRPSPTANTSTWAYKPHGAYDLVTNMPAEPSPLLPPTRIEGIPSSLSAVRFRASSIDKSIEDCETTEILSLADISDLQVRSKISQLLAIAPGVPVKDLHNLLLEMEGHFEKARESVLRHVSCPTGISPTPVDAVYLKLKSFQEVFQPHSSHKDTIAVDGEDRDEEAVMMKIELEDPEIWNDNDIMASLAPTIRRPKQLKLPKSKTRNSFKSKFQRKAKGDSIAMDKLFSLKSLDDKLHPYTSPSKFSPHAWTSLTDDVGAKRMTLPGRHSQTGSLVTTSSEYTQSIQSKYSPPDTPPKVLRHRDRRRNSIGNVFVIADNDSDSKFDSDGSYRDCHSDVDTEDDSMSEGAMDGFIGDLWEDLQINMTRPFQDSGIKLGSQKP